ncbi:MAG: MotA/TolQ/ExbB proton channel family protein, partial [Prevotella sp.]|nr:MotA/TolQ/ExbB proton channel family protein [Prevotella sp.]
MNLFVLLQNVQTVAEITGDAPASGISYFDLVLKGGWVMLPIFLLSLLSIYLILEKSLVISRLG